MINSSLEKRSVVILGAGPAGYTAAIYAARANLSPLVIRGPLSGGQLVQTRLVENYPGFVNGILGPELMTRFEQQAERFGTEYKDGTITAVHFGQHPFAIAIDGEWSLLADAVIIAMGATNRFLGLIEEETLLGRGLSTCATCDGIFFKGEEVAVIGGGDAALENALALSHLAAHVYVVHRRESLRASKIMQMMAFQHSAISFIWNSQVVGILGEQEVRGLKLLDLATQDISILEVKGVFLAIGHSPNTQIFQEWLDLDSKGYILTQPDSTRTSIPGVFACGDVQDGVYRQAITAAGRGCMAAIDAEHWLQNRARG